VEGVEPIGLGVATELQGADGSYSTVLDRGWEIWGPSGGYLAALSLRAAGECAQIQRPVSYYCHFLSPPEFDAVEIEVETLRSGRRAEAFSVRMSQGGGEFLRAMVRTAAEAPGYEHREVTAPAVEGPEDSPPFERPAADGKPLYPFWGNVSCRRPGGGAPEGERAQNREWVRFDPVEGLEDPFLDAARSLVLLDTFGWPATWQRYRGADFVAPNLDTAVWFHRPALHSPWLLVDHAAPVAGDGLIGVGGQIWSEDGELVASGGAQLLCLPRP
jgi:acyl-CoA thioesterase